MKTFTHTITVLFLLLNFYACEDKENKEDNESERLEVGSTNVNFGADGSSQTVNIFSNLSYWSVSYNGGGWLQVSPSSGSKNGSIQITTNKNSSTSSRDAVISISGGSQRIVLGISQNGSTNTGGGELPAPTGISASKNGSSISISWNAVSGATSYFVYRSNSSDGTYSSLTSVSSTSGVDASPMNGDNYYKVKASNGSKTSDFSSYAYVNYTTGGGTTKPNVPTGVRVSNEGNSIIPMIAIRWNSVSDATSYKVYRGTSASGVYSQIGNTTTNNVLVDDNPREGTTYYKVKAINSAGESDYSAYASVEYKANDVAPCPVTYGSCTVSGTTITMRWTTSNTTGCGAPTKAYLRVRNPDSGVYVDLQTLSATATSASFTYTPWVDSNGYVYVGIILENAKGTSGGTPKVYDNKGKKWIN